MTQPTQSISEFLDELWTGLDAAPKSIPGEPQRAEVELPEELLDRALVVPSEARNPSLSAKDAAAKKSQPVSQPRAPFSPPSPRSLKETGLSEDQIARLILKLLAARGAVTGRGIAAHIRLPFTIVECVLASLRQEQLLALKGEGAVGDYNYIVSEKGIAIARELARECT